MSSMFEPGTAVADAPVRAQSAHPGNLRFKYEEQGYHKGLSARQIQMIGIGGAIGTGLFMGAGGRLAAAGPGLVLVYAVCGFFAFLILRWCSTARRRVPLSRTPGNSSEKKPRSPSAGCTGSTGP